MDDSIRELLDSSRNRSAQRRMKSRPATSSAASLADARPVAAVPPADLPNQPAKKQLPLTAGRATSLADQRIEAAIRDGAFENLEGMGRPLDLYDDVHIPADMRMAFRMLKSQQVAAPWIGPLRDYERMSAAYAAWHADMRLIWPALHAGQRNDVYTTLHKRLKALNDLIHLLNAVVPNDSLRQGLRVYARELAAIERP